MWSKEEKKKYLQMGIYERSIALVTELFQKKLDKGNHHYLEHLEHVSHDFKEERKKSMALLHDVLEDTSVTKEDLLEIGYDEEFIHVLELLTNTYPTYQEYIEHLLASNNKDAFEIKMKDLLHNMDLTRVKKITKQDLKRTEKYIKAYLRIIEKLESDENVR